MGGTRFSPCSSKGHISLGLACAYPVSLLTKIIRIRCLDTPFLKTKIIMNKDCTHMSHGEYIL